MASNNSKYSEEMRTQTAEHILRSGKSATSVAEEVRIDTNAVCRWVRDYRRAKGLPSYSEGKEQQKSTGVAQVGFNLFNRMFTTRDSKYYKHHRYWTYRQ